MGALLNPDSLTAVGQQKDIEQAAQTVGLRVQFLKASNEPELEAAFQAIIEIRIPALLVPADAFFRGFPRELPDRQCKAVSRRYFHCVKPLSPVVL